MTAPGKRTLDRMSNFPDCILSKILSSLDTKYAVQTSVLSKRWKNFWTTLLNLNLDSTLFKSLSKFEEFVRQVLGGRDRTIKIDNFIFHHPSRINFEILETIAHYAFSHNVQHLKVTYESEVHNTFLPFPNSSDSLRSLNLAIKDQPFWRPYTRMRKNYFKQLVSLHLDYIELDDADPFSGCPNLKDLVLINSAYLHAPFTMNIIAAKLTSLTLVFDKWILSPAEIVVSTPKLCSLEVKRHLSIRKVPFLSVKSSHGLLVLDSVTLDVKDSSDNLISLLELVGNATSVALSSYMVELLSSAAPHKLAQNPSPFANLKTLKFIGFMRDMPVKVPALVMTYLLRNTSCENVVMEVPRCKTCRD